MTPNHSVRALALLLTVTLPFEVFAQAAAGVSDERVNLPNAPGSISGVGENAVMEGNQGALAYSVNVEVPQGFPGVTPEIGFSYSSSGGSDVLGMGWSMPNFSIERMTSKGLQHYDVDDRFVANGSDELVRVAQSGTSATYRSRFEAGFVRYTWLARGTGEAGSWKAEFPDGRVGYYGADEQGTAATAAQVIVPTTNRVFRWHLVVMLDRFGHRMTATWTKDPGGVSLLDRLDYVFEAGQPRHSVRFVYEARPDAISDAKPGFDLRLTRRLTEVRIFSAAEQVRSYVLTYEGDSAAGGASRLARVNRLGRNGAAYPITFNFGYSHTLGGVCAADCEKPFVKDMGALGVDFAAGRATLIDINGDALPDVLSTSGAGIHTFYYARLDAEGRTSFSTTGVTSAQTVGSSSLILGNPAVQVIDIDGDGFVDITNARTGEVLCNKGGGDWTAQPTDCKPTSAAVDGTYALDDDVADPMQADPLHIRFFDYDNDKRIDFLKTDPGGTTSVLANTPAGYVASTAATIGEVFDDTALQLADMNGDGLQDPVILRTSGSAVQVSYRLNFGFGVWSAWHDVTVSGFDPSQIAVIELQDMNGDELTDLVAVVGNEIKLSLNRNADRFDPVRTISTADLGSGVIPSRVSTTVVSFADMNGNGSSDVVWIQMGGAISYLELFPVRPNLLSRIDNGLGAVQRFSYGSSILEQARDVMASMPWLNKVPNPMTLLTAMETFVTLTGSDMNGAAAPSGLVERTQYRYHSGFYDGVEKQFRGYEGVERQMDSDLSRDAQEPGLIVETYDVGKTSPILAGRAMKSVMYAGAAPNRALISETRMLWALCPVAESTNTQFACDRATTTIVTERDAANALTTKDERDYDGYGNVIATRDLGVTNLGTPEQPRPCAPCMASGLFGAACGDMCLGDESFSEGDFISPGSATGNLWLIGQSSEQRRGAVAGTWATVARSFYDGPDFVGLGTGQLTLGNVTRTEAKLDTTFVTQKRNRYDAHGNVVETIDALGSLADTTKHRRRSSFDGAGLRLTGVEVLVGSAEVDSIRKDAVTDTAWELITQTSNWYAVKGGTALSSPQLTRVRYDDHGRYSRGLLPGDADSSPTTTVTYELGDPASRILVTQRTDTNPAHDIVEARCLDGQGRQFQSRQRLSASSWQVSGFTEFDARGQPVRRYQPYLGTTGACEMAPPANVPFTRFVYDPAGRLLSETEPDGKQRRREYGPLVTRKFDEEDNDPADPFTNTPDVDTADGLGRITSSSRQLATNGRLSTNTFGYDALGNLFSVRDAAGNLHTQVSDSFGRVVQVDDANAGRITTEWDVQGNIIRVTDARNKVLAYEFDGANRLTARFDPDDTAWRFTYRYDVLPGCTECTNTGNEVVQMTWPGATAGGEERYGYDTRENRVFTERIIAGHSFVTRRRFDLAQRPIGIVHPDGTSFDTTLDGAGRPTAVSGAVTSAEYNERGRVSRVSFTNGTTTEYGYDGRVRLTSVKTTGSAGPILDLSLTLSGSGDLTALGDGALPGRLRHAAQFTLDAWSRVTRVALPGTREETLDYAFDELDNITSATSSVGAASAANAGAYTYQSTKPNAAVIVGGVARTYDAAGELTGLGDKTFTRDALGRMVSVSSPAGEGRFTYSDLERIAKEEGDATTWYISRNFEVRDGIAVAYAELEGAHVMRSESDSLAATLLSDLAPTSGSGTLTVQGDSKIDIADAWLSQAKALGLVQLTGGPTPSEPGKLLRSAARRLLIEDATWLHRDHLDTALIATDADGAVRGERSYYPMGALREEAGFVDVKGFTDQELDESTGLLHFRYRELDPISGRWDRPDPSFLILSPGALGRTGEYNTGYAYVGNQFADARDPNGLDLGKMKGPRKKLTAWLVKKLKGSRAGKATGKAAAAVKDGAVAVKDGAVKLGHAAVEQGEKALDGFDRKSEGARLEEFNHQPDLSEKIATGVSLVSSIAGFITSAMSFVEKYIQGVDDKDKNKDLETAGTWINTTNTVSTSYMSVRAAYRFKNAKALPKGTKAVAKTESSSEAPPAANAQSKQSN